MNGKKSDTATDTATDTASPTYANSLARITRGISAIRVLIPTLGKLELLTTICRRYNIPRPKLRALARKHHIPIVYDDKGRAYISLSILDPDHTILDPDPNPSFDRWSMVRWISGTQSVKPVANIRIKAYNRKVESEIRRIARLPENERVIQAVEFMVKFMECELIADAIQPFIKTYESLPPWRRHHLTWRVAEIAKMTDYLFVPKPIERKETLYGKILGYMGTEPERVVGNREIWEKLMLDKDLVVPVFCKLLKKGYVDKVDGGWRITRSGMESVYGVEAGKKGPQREGDNWKKWEEGTSTSATAGDITDDTDSTPAP